MSLMSESHWCYLQAWWTVRYLEAIHWGFLKEGIKTYLIEPTSPLNSPTCFSVFHFHSLRNLELNSVPHTFVTNFSGDGRRGSPRGKRLRHKSRAVGAHNEFRQNSGESGRRQPLVLRRCHGRHEGRPRRWSRRGRRIHCSRRDVDCWRKELLKQEGSEQSAVHASRVDVVLSEQVVVTSTYSKEFMVKYPPITYYWTVPLILYHSYLVERLTSSKIAHTKVSGF